MGPSMGIEENRPARLDQKDEQINQLVELLAQSESELRHLHETIRKLEAVIDEMSGSASFKLAQGIARPFRLLAPPGTRRRRVLHLGHRGLRAVPKLGNGKWVAGKIRSLVNGSGAKPGPVTDSSPIAEESPAEERQFHKFSPNDPPHFPVRDSVDVSIVIPVFNHWQSTLTCLESIAELTNEPSFEVIVVDDRSSDETPELLEHIDGVVTLRNEQTLGFVGSCNRGAAAARGTFLVFLSNNSVVTLGWLDALLRTFRTIPGTGLAGAKLVYPDGRLQEAGCVIWHDANGWSYGKYDDAGHPGYNFAREVDYCSGACVMVPRSLFWDLGGFDIRYAPRITQTPTSRLRSATPDTK